MQSNSLKSWWRHAFAVGGPQTKWSSADRELVDRLADFIVRRRLAAAAFMALEAGRPFNFLGSQALTFLSPFATLVFAPDEYRRFTQILEKRDCVDLILEAIARRENEGND